MRFRILCHDSTLIPTVLATATVVCVWTSAALAGPVPGDVNGDQAVNAVDVQLVINAALGLDSPYNCDVDGSMSVNAVDVQLVINAALGLTIPVTVPDVVGMTQAEAEASILAAGLSVGPIAQQYSSTTPSGNVISHDPAAGVSVMSGSVVSLVVSRGPLDEIVVFPDANLEQVVREHIGKPSGAIYASDLSAVYALDGPSRNIANLTGLEYCSHITGLDLSGNDIQNVGPLANLDTLQQLNVRDNQIADIGPLALLDKLVQLDLSGNQIEDVAALSDLLALEWLYLGDNRIDDIGALSGLTLLIELGLGGNLLDDLGPLAGLVDLNLLHLGNNRIEDLGPLQGLTNLKELYLNDNLVRDVAALVPLKKLTYVNLLGNMLGQDALCRDIPLLQLNATQVQFEGTCGIIQLPGGVPLDMVYVPQGEFQMGSFPGEQDAMANELPQHRVVFSQGFWMSKYEITKRQWQAVMNTAPWSGEAYVLNDLDSPAVFVTWHDARAFAAALSAYTGMTLRLPSEAEWEYAARGGTNTRFYWGNDPTWTEIYDYAWMFWNTMNINEGYAHVVGQKLPNAYGLYDMSGNVSEWCEDDYHDSYTGAPDDGSAWVDAPRGAERLVRGGDWAYANDLCRMAARWNRDPSIKAVNHGFRVVR